MTRWRGDRKVKYRGLWASAGRAAHAQYADRIELDVIARPLAGAFARLIAFVQQFKLFQLLE